MFRYMVPDVSHVPEHGYRPQTCARNHVSVHDSGCEPCTRPIKIGEDIRAGRWWWENDTNKECGLHMDHDK